jgi:hypothetical protein
MWQRLYFKPLPHQQGWFRRGADEGPELRATPSTPFNHFQIIFEHSFQQTFP